VTIPLFPTPTEPTPGWLTAVLHNSGILGNGAVDSVKITPSAAFNSRTAFLQLSYTKDSPPSAPKRMMLKRNTEQAWSVAAGEEEVRCYHLVAGLADHPRILAPYIGLPMPIASANTWPTVLLHGNGSLGGMPAFYPRTCDAFMSGFLGDCRAILPKNSRRASAPIAT
jgi:hypothetical protein